MALPETVRVKLSSEGAEFITVTPVVVREIAVRELVEELLATIGKDAERIRAALRRGSFISGATRYRWQGWEAEAGDIEGLLAEYPDADPSRTFIPSLCARAVLYAPALRIELPREAAGQRRLLKRTDFWEILMRAAGEAMPRYIEYSYRHRSDRFRLEMTPSGWETLRSNASLLKYPTLASQIRTASVAFIEFFVERK